MSLSTVRAKFARAREHEAAFQACLDDYVGGNNFELLHDFDENTGWNEIRFKEINPPPSEQLALILGDVLTNARGVLDYLAWQLVLAAGNTPGKHTMFPVVTQQAKWPAVANGCLKGVDQQWIDAIAKLQPFNESDPKLHPLASLDHMNNVGKHRTIPGAVQTAQPLEFSVKTIPGEKIDFDPVEPRLEDGAILFRARPHDKSRLEIGSLGLTVRFAFDDERGVEWDIADVLTWVNQTITQFEPAFKS